MASLIKKFHKAAKESKPSVICWGSGSPFREFLYADDLGDAAVFALEKWNPDAKNSPKDEEGNPLLHLNVGTGKEFYQRSCYKNRNIIEL